MAHVNSSTNEIYEQVTNIYSANYISYMLLFTKLPFIFSPHIITKQQFSYLHTIYNQLLPHDIISIVTGLTVEDLYDDIFNDRRITPNFDESETVTESYNYALSLVNRNIYNYSFCTYYENYYVSENDAYFLQRLGERKDFNMVNTRVSKKHKNISKTCLL